MYGSSRRNLHALAAALGVALLMSGSPAFAEGYRDQWHPTQLEVAKLPQYCHGQYIPELKGKPGFRIDNCGTYMNHFCPGLVMLNRAADLSKPKPQRREILREAKTEVVYTRSFLPANCPIEPDIRAAESRLKLLEMMLK